MSTLLYVNGYRIFVYSHDHPHPIHVHVTKGGGTSKWELRPLSCTKHNKKFSAGELQKIQRILDENYVIILEKWNEEFKRHG